MTQPSLFFVRSYKSYALLYLSSPESAMTTFLLGVPRGDPTASTLRTTSMPSVTFPNTVCRPSNLDE